VKRNLSLAASLCFLWISSVQGATVSSISIGSFSPSNPVQNGTTSNNGSISGSGSGTIKYHWITRKPGVIYVDSGELTVSMTNGSATIPSYNGFPTDLAGDYQAFIRVTLFCFS